jgi:Leucine-rich repeat (LRR) protein
LIPDAIFEKYLVDSKIDNDGLVNGRMNVEDAKGVSAISVNSKDIKSLAGIEVFTDLQALSCPNNQLTTLDVSKNINLYRLFCPNNQITILDVNKNLQALYYGKRI